MLTIDKNNKITLTRGDTLTLTIEPTFNGETYTPLAGDVFRIAISEKYLGEAMYELKTEAVIPNDTLTVIIPASETKKLKYKTYNYDIEVKHADGVVDTFISSTITIVGETL